MLKSVVSLTLLLAATASLSAVVIPFDLQGKAGFGLLSGNENGTINGTPGSGGEIGAGISFDDVTRDLTINVGWGTGNGFTNLSGNATAGHIHGPTPSVAPASFNENVGVLIGLDSLAGWNNSATAGGIFNVTVNLSTTQATQLMNGQLYINVHTATNGPGEIRGNLVPVPEPSTVALLAGFVVTGLAIMRRRRS